MLVCFLFTSEETFCHFWRHMSPLNLPKQTLSQSKCDSVVLYFMVSPSGSIVRILSSRVRQSSLLQSSKHTHAHAHTFKYWKTQQPCAYYKWAVTWLTFDTTSSRDAAAAAVHPAASDGKDAGGSVLYGQKKQIKMLTLQEMDSYMVVFSSEVTFRV